MGYSAPSTVNMCYNFESSPQYFPHLPNIIVVYSHEGCEALFGNKLTETIFHPSLKAFMGDHFHGSIASRVHLTTGEITEQRKIV